MVADVDVRWSDVHGDNQYVHNHPEYTTPEQCCPDKRHSDDVWLGVNEQQQVQLTLGLSFLQYKYLRHYVSSVLGGV